MKINELRIGNIVRIGRDHAVVNRIESNGIGFDRADNFGPDYIKIEKVEGVPITEKRLLLVGFEKGKFGNLSIDFGDSILILIPSHVFFYPVYSMYSELHAEENQDVHLNRIQYMHELQNLYFTLRGEELIKTSENEK